MMQTNPPGACSEEFDIVSAQKMIADLRTQLAAKNAALLAAAEVLNKSMAWVSENGSETVLSRICKAAARAARQAAGG